MALLLGTRCLAPGGHLLTTRKVLAHPHSSHADSRITDASEVPPQGLRSITAKAFILVLDLISSGTRVPEGGV